MVTFLSNQSDGINEHLHNKREKKLGKKTGKTSTVHFKAAIVTVASIFICFIIVFCGFSH